MSTHVEYIKTVERIEKKKCQGGPITERLNFKINTEFKILGLKSKNEEEKNIRVKNFKMLTQNGRNNENKNVKGGANNGKTTFKNKYTVFF